MSSIPNYTRIAEEIKEEWLSDDCLSGPRKLPTQEELAQQFGVSRATIIRALARLAAEGCVHSMQGRGVYITAPLQGDAGVERISLIVPNLNAPVIVDACRGIERRARQLGYQVLLASSEFGLEHERELIEQHIKTGVRGVVLYPVTRSAQDLANDYLAHWSSDIPIVTIDIECKTWRCSRILFDNTRLAYDMTQHLIRRNRRHIAFMTAQPDRLHSSIHDRQRGWMTAMQEACLEIPSAYREWPLRDNDIGISVPNYAPTQDQYDALAKSLLDLQPRPDAVIVWDDVVAAHLIHALMHLGVRVPEEICVTGFDHDPSIGRLFRPLFPTSRPDFMRLGELAVDILAELISGMQKQPCTYFYSVPVVWREPHNVAAQNEMFGGLEQTCVPT